VFERGVIVHIFAGSRGPPTAFLVVGSPHRIHLPFGGGEQSLGMGGRFVGRRRGGGTAGSIACPVKGWGLVFSRVLALVAFLASLSSTASAPFTHTKQPEETVVDLGGASMSGGWTAGLLACPARRWDLIASRAWAPVAFLASQSSTASAPFTHTKQPEETGVDLGGASLWEFWQREQADVALGMPMCLHRSGGEAVEEGELHWDEMRALGRLSLVDSQAGGRG
jgi:hypothetical protein